MVQKERITVLSLVATAQARSPKVTEATTYVRIRKALGSREGIGLWWGSFRVIIDAEADMLISSLGAGRIIGDCG
jgi:hypothetical protein